MSPVRILNTHHKLRIPTYHGNVLQDEVEIWQPAILYAFPKTFSNHVVKNWNLSVVLCDNNRVHEKMQVSFFLMRCWGLKNNTLSSLKVAPRNAFWDVFLVKTLVKLYFGIFLAPKIFKNRILGYFLIKNYLENYKMVKFKKILKH